MKILVKVLVVLCCIHTSSYAQKLTLSKLDGTKITGEEIDSAVTSLMNKATIHGLSLAILNNNKTVFIKSYGYKNKYQNQWLDTATIMYGASLSKAIFGYLVLKLVEEKLLNLDKPLYKYLQKPIADYSYFADLKNDERWKLITARMCLSHTTGLPNVRWFNPITGEEDTLGTMKIFFEPGSKYAYSGEGFKLLQLVVEEIAKKTTDELAIEKIFNPIGMHRTGYVWHNSFEETNVAVGHLANGTIDKKKKRTEAVAGGSLVTTIADYSKFIEYVMQKKGLKKKTFTEMISPQIRIHSKTQFPPLTFETTTENKAINLSYGLGWGLFNCINGRAFFKEGNGGSWRNYNVNFIDKGISIIILINSENGESIFKELVEATIGNSCIPWKWEGYTSK